ncbi:SAYSvFN domain-containing protein 1 [Brachionichthys hirsutus]|uniref:SAYSvFN domain-containing protein 1 n=1 Tax=Brachionichthys hirsutus TaxID=412623 RepID=UPI003604DE44
METKLAAFRARRRVEKVDIKDELQTVTEPAPPTGGQHEQEAGSGRDSPQSAATKRDWLLDSALGRWLASKQFAFSNIVLLKLLLWLVLLGLFVELEFGLPFFVISLFYWLYEGLRSPAERHPGELSAYSVFNPDCRPLLGSLTAEQLEGEMGYRPLANR